MVPERRFAGLRLAREGQALVRLWATSLAFVTAACVTSPPSETRGSSTSSAPGHYKHEEHLLATPLEHTLEFVRAMRIKAKWYVDIHEGAVFGEPDFRRREEDVHLARATAAFVMSKDLADGTPMATNRDVLSRMCRRHCGEELTRATAEILELPNLARASGVLVRDRVVATSTHVKDNILDGRLDEVLVLLDFDGDAEPTQFSIPRACRNDEIALVALDTKTALPEGITPLDPPSGPVTWSGPRPTLAFGHPLGSARLATGDNEHTMINECEVRMGQDTTVQYRAMLDSLQGSSGSPVFLASPSEGWTLFGLLKGSAGNSVRCRRNGTCDIQSVPCIELDPCRQSDGTARGAHIASLVGLDQALDAFARGETPDSWSCSP